MLGELMKQAYQALRYNRSRSLLTMLGMAWGIATVVLLLAYGSGFERGLMIAFQTFGGDIIGIFPGRTALQAGGSKAGTEIKLTVQDIDFLRAEVPLIKRISPQAIKQAVVNYGTRSASYPAQGTFANYQQIRRLDMAEGSFFTSDEDFTHSRVAVLGSEVKKKLFSGQNAIGEKIRVDGITYEVVGVMKRTIPSGDEDTNSIVYVPFSAMGDLRNTHYLDGIWLEYEGDNAKVAKTVRDSMAFHHNFDPKDERAVFVFDSVKELVEIHIITVGIKVLLGFIGLLTLGIGGVGLMNIMLVSVSQRTREIGVEKALGARRWHILFQFLSEALVITLVGGLAGVGLAYLVSWSVGSLTLWSAFMEDAKDGDIRLKIDSAILIWSTVILGFVGIVSGMLPAMKAASLDPIEALRYE